jgi:hypothetical protein
MQGRLLLYAQLVLYNLLPYKKRIYFFISALDNVVTLSIIGLTNIPKIISGFLTTLFKYIELQRLNSLFKSINYYKDKKALLAVLLK